MSAQTSSHIVMVRPAAFGYNVETAENNAFQNKPVSGKETIIQKAIKEFDNLVQILRAEGIVVEVIQDTSNPAKPDAIFPNNWLSLHDNGMVVTYPIFSPLRRPERRVEIIQHLARHYQVKEHLAMEYFESQGLFLEGTGSMVLDRVNKIAYACLSPRTDRGVLQVWCEKMGYTPFTFIAMYDQQEVYHTNVMMAIGEGVCVASLEIVNQSERVAFRNHLAAGGREVVELSREQIGSFAGNMLAVRNQAGEQLMVMSSTAHQSLDKEQVEAIEKYARIVSGDIRTIESVGGGSVRCMIAENFLPHI